MDEQQVLRGLNVEPTGEVIAKALGKAGSAYFEFIEGVESRNIQVNRRYYNDGKAWLGKALYKWTTTRGTQKEITASWLSVWDGFFKVCFMFPAKHRNVLLSLPLAPATKNDRTSKADG